MIECRMPRKLQMLHSHLDEFKSNMEALFGRRRGTLHQDIMDFGQFTESILGDYIWGLIRKTSTEHYRKSKTVNF